MTDQLRRILTDAAAGRFPEADGGITVLPPDDFSGQHAIIELTGHAVFATDLDRSDLEALGADGYGGADDPALVLAVAGPDAWIDVNDVVLVATGTGEGGRVIGPTDLYDDHPRVRYARSFRRDVVVHGDDHGFVTIGRGLAGRWDVGFSLVDTSRSRGHGRELLADAVRIVPAGEPLFASCAPGNARSLRSLLASGFTPIGGERLIRRPAPTRGP